MKDRSILSIDFDFFVPEDSNWDWSHAETPLYIETMWQIRAAQAGIVQEDITKKCGIAACEPSPGDFWSMLKRCGYQIDQNTLLTVGESHAQAYPALSREACRGPLDILHFDAHADIGYEPTAKSTATLLYERGKVECGSWLLALAMTHPKYIHTSFVYPQWRGLKEWNRLDDRENRLSYLKSHRVVVFDPRELVRTETPVKHVFICRSGAWVPPWLDLQFQKFVNECPVNKKHRKILKANGMDPMRARPFDLEGAKRDGEKMRQQMGKFKFV